MTCRADGGALDACCSELQGGGGGQQPGRAAGGGGGERGDGGAALALPRGQAVDTNSSYLNMSSPAITVDATPLNPPPVEPTDANEPQNHAGAGNRADTGLENEFMG